MPAKWAGRPVLVRWQLERAMYDFKNSFSLAFVHIHRAKCIFFRDMFCLPHFLAKIHGVSTVAQLSFKTLVLSSFATLTHFFQYQTFAKEVCLLLFVCRSKLFVSPLIIINLLCILIHCLLVCYVIKL